MNKLRNIGIIAHINAGKTTTTERFLYHAGFTKVVGDVDRGNTVTDYLTQERDRGITITSAAISFDWKRHRFNLVDTPGHVDFTIEVERSLSVLDSALMVIDSSAGVEAQTITVWNQARKYKLPNIVFLNKYDKIQADYKVCLAELSKVLGMKPSLLQLPIKDSRNNLSIIDIITRKHFVWKNPSIDYGEEYNIDDVRSNKEHHELVEEKREAIVNDLADLDSELADHVLACDKICDVTDEEIIAAVRRATINCLISPVLVGSSFKYIGVQQLMNAVVDYLPDPKERELQINGQQMVLQDHKTNCAFVFKIIHDKRLGALNFIKVCNGEIKKLQRVINLDTDTHEQIKKIYRVFADDLKEIDSPVTKSDIVAVTGLVSTRTGDILVDQCHKIGSDPSTADEDRDECRSLFRVLNGSIIVPRIRHMEPVYSCSIESRNVAQQLKLENALACLSREDPSFLYEVDQFGIITIKGMGKLHLEVIRDRIETEYNIQPLLGPLQISYRETIQGSAIETLQVSKMINGVSNKLTICLSLRPKPNSGSWGPKMLRLDSAGENSLSQLKHHHRKAIESGIMSALCHGPSLGYPMIDCDIQLKDFSCNGHCGLPVISSATSECLTNAILRSKPILLEPVMMLEVCTPREFNGSILAELTGSRRGMVMNTSGRSDGFMVIRAQVPLANMSDYSEYLRIVSSGRATFSMELHDYSPMSELDRSNMARL